MSVPAEVPAKPDPLTGEPRPPDAPRWDPDKGSDVDRDRPVPDPPSGCGPVLESFVTKRSAVFNTAIGGFFIIMGGILCGETPHTRALIWLRHKKKYLETYELNRIKVLTGGSIGSKSLELRDSDGREVYIRLGELEANRRLWNLVYNAMVHSVAERDAQLKGLNADRVLHPEQYRRQSRRRATLRCPPSPARVEADFS